MRQKRGMEEKECRRPDYFGRKHCSLRCHRALGWWSEREREGGVKGHVEEPICLIGYHRGEGGMEGGCVMAQRWLNMRLREWARRRRRGFIRHECKGRFWLLPQPHATHHPSVLLNEELGSRPYLMFWRFSSSVLQPLCLNYWCRLPYC